MKNNVVPAIIVFPASNCEKDMEQVLKEVFHLDPIMIWHKATTIPHEVTHIILPGGFSFGDYLRPGALSALSPIMTAVKKFAEAAGPILGVCNGFQILCEAKLLPGVLLKNHHDRFVCTVSELTWFYRNQNMEPLKIRLPIAHREGRYYADPQTLQKLKENRQIILTYNERDENNNAAVNGSLLGIAGIVSGVSNNIMGLMPHPERMAQESLLGRDGCIILKDFLFG